ncbi:MAG: DUF2306 domain-containing protein [Bacteroidota bacterium]
MKRLTLTKVFHFLLFTAGLFMVVHVLGIFSEPVDRLLSFMTVKPIRLLDVKKELASHLWWSVPFYVHITFASIGVLAGAFQFLLGKRITRTSVHAGLGIAYLVGFGVASVTSLWLSLFLEAAPAGEPEFYLGKIAFGLFSLAWIRSIYLLARYVRQRNRPEHIKWAIRSYALTMAAVVYRMIFLPLHTVFGFSFTNSLLLAVALSPIFTSLVAEIIIHWTQVKRWFKKPVYFSVVRSQD